MRICIIGCGEIGTANGCAYAEHEHFRPLLVNFGDQRALQQPIKPREQLHIGGVDPSADACANFCSAIGKRGAQVSATTGLILSRYHAYDLYSVCAFEQRAILQMAMEALAASKPHDGLVAVEATMSLETARSLQAYCEQAGDLNRCLIFPHRWNPGDKEHSVFNQPRLIGVFTEAAVKRAEDFYGRLLNYKQTSIVSWVTAVMAKLTENATRFFDIVIAQELKLACDAVDMEFNDLREAVNTKWNLDLKEPRDGVGGRCLPKDTLMFLDALPTHHLGRLMYRLNEQYSMECKLNKLPE
jgi:UDP-glucose 6-dehydrogenase